MDAVAAIVNGAEKRRVGSSGELETFTPPPSSVPNFFASARIPPRGAQGDMRLTGWPFDVVMGCAFVAYLPLVPAVTRWARVLWMYVDRHFDP